MKLSTLVLLYIIRQIALMLWIDKIRRLNYSAVSRKFALSLSSIRESFPKISQNKRNSYDYVGRLWW